MIKTGFYCSKDLADFKWVLQQLEKEHFSYEDNNGEPLDGVPLINNLVSVFYRSNDVDGEGCILQVSKNTGLIKPMSLKYYREYQDCFDDPTLTNVHSLRAHYEERQNQIESSKV